MTHKILIIDDDPAINDLMCLLLRSNGFTVLSAQSGNDGVSIARENTPDLIILDLMMPDLDGWKVCNAIRGFSNAPVLILSAINDPQMVASILDTGADDFLVKPVSTGILLAHVKKMVRRTGPLSEVKPLIDPNIGRKTQPVLPSAL